MCNTVPKKSIRQLSDLQGPLFDPVNWPFPDFVARESVSLCHIEAMGAFNFDGFFKEVTKKCVIDSVLKKSIRQLSDFCRVHSVIQ